MPRLFSPATAEQVVAVVSAAVSNPDGVTETYCMNFTELQREQTEKALKLATDLGFLSEDSNSYTVLNPLSRCLITKNDDQRAAVVRIVLESYEPFVCFRRFLETATNADMAAQQTRTLLDIDLDRHSLKDSLVNLGTYGRCLIAQGAGQYKLTDASIANDLELIAKGCADLAQAEARIRTQLREASTSADVASVVRPLAQSLLRAIQDDPRGAIVEAGNAVESWLAGAGTRLQVNLASKTGINSKIDELKRAKQLPSKIVNYSKYVGHLRNAADHGTDPEINAAWEFDTATGLEFVFVACSLLRAIQRWEVGGAKLL